MGIVSTVQEAIGGLAARTLFRGRIAQMDRMTALLQEAYREGPYTMPPEQLVRRLAETMGGDRLFDLVYRLSDKRVLIGGMGFGSFEQTEDQRRRVVDESRLMYETDGQAENAVAMWSAYGLGQQVQIKTKDPAAQPVWDDFFTARRNAAVLSDDALPERSDQALRDGEFLFLHFVSTINGDVTTRVVETTEIKRVIYDKEDPAGTPILYEVSTGDGLGSVFYADWRATREQIEAAVRELPSGSSVNVREWRGRTGREAYLAEAAVNSASPNAVIREAALGIIAADKKTRVLAQLVAPQKIRGRGWPMFRRAYRWMRAMNDTVADQLTLARAVATYLDRVTVDGGSREVSAVRQRLESTIATAASAFERNPAPSVGSSYVHNKAVEVDRMPLGSAASDARDNTMLVAAMISMASKLPIFMQGRPDMVQNRSVAEVTMRPWAETMVRYQTFWTGVFRDMVEIVLRMAEEYPDNGGMVRKFSTYAITTTMESPTDVSVEEIEGAITAVADAATRGVMSMPTAQAVVKELTRILVAALGVRLPDEGVRGDGGGMGDQGEGVGAEELSHDREVAERIGRFYAGIFCDEEASTPEQKTAGIYAGVVKRIADRLIEDVMMGADPVESMSWAISEGASYAAGTPLDGGENAGG